MTPPSRSPADEQALSRARADERASAAEKDTLVQEAEANKARAEELQSELAAIDAPIQAAKQAYEAQKREHDEFSNTLQAAQTFAETCDVETSPMLAAETGAAYAAYLGSFIADDARDATLKTLEKCRKLIVSEWQKVMKTNIEDLRHDLAIEIEDTFDENNPYSRGKLTAKVSATTLSVRMRGNFEGRARHSQDQVDMWCERGEGVFTKVTLKNSHGTFSCTSPKRPADLINEILQDAKVASSWILIGDQELPATLAPPPPPSEEVVGRRQAVIAELGQLGINATAFESRAATIANKQVAARSTQERVRARDLARVSTWKTDETNKAKKVQTAGGILVGLGAAAVLATVGTSQLGVTDPSSAIPVGVGIGLPILTTGILLLIGGGVRKNRIASLPAK